MPAAICPSVDHNHRESKIVLKKEIQKRILRLKIQRKPKSHCSPWEKTQGAHAVCWFLLPPSIILCIAFNRDVVKGQMGYLPPCPQWYSLVSVGNTRRCSSCSSGFNMFTRWFIPECELSRMNNSPPPKKVVVTTCACWLNIRGALGVHVTSS